MPAKRDILENFTRDRLIEIAREFDIRFDYSWKKEDLIRAIERGRKVTKENLEVLARKEGRISAIVKDEKSRFFESTAVEAFDYHNRIIGALSSCISVTEIGNATTLKNLEMLSSECEDLKVMKNKKIPPNMKKQLSDRQIRAYYISIKAVNSAKRTLDEAIAIVKSDEKVKVQWYVEGSNLPSKVKHYLSEAYRCYVVNCYDSTIVMLARSIEYSLKDYFETNGISYPAKATLGKLAGIYQKDIGQNATLKKIIEVQTMDRNICAHDRPQTDWQAGVKDANHTWTAISVVLRDLLSFDLKMDVKVGT